LTYYSGDEKRQAAVTLADVRQPPLPANGALTEPQLSPQPSNARSPGVSTAERIEQLERRISELEKRLQRLERAAQN
jgi:hypothetical protein